MSFPASECIYDMSEVPKLGYGTHYNAKAKALKYFTIISEEFFLQAVNRPVIILLILASSVNSYSFIHVVSQFHTYCTIHIYGVWERGLNILPKIFYNLQRTNSIFRCMWSLKLYLPSPSPSNLAPFPRPVAIDYPYCVRLLPMMKSGLTTDVFVDA